jgi:multiple sugar transport system substrate-binding protein
MKKIIAMLLVLVMALSLVACGGKSEKVELNVIAAEYGTQTKAWWQGFEKDFEAANENIDLVVDVVSWNDIYTVVNTRISNNDAPDILNIDVFADYQADGLLLPAQDYISDETYAKFYQSFLDQSVVDGTVWAVPDLASARAMYYNKDILAEVGVEVPTTWDELVDVANKIKEFYNGEVYPWGVDMTTDEGQACFSYYIWNNGGSFVDAEGNWTLNSAENVEAIEFIIGMVNDGLTNSDPAQETRYANQDMFGAGKVAMMIGPNSIPAYLTAGGYSINWGVASIPTNNANGSVSQGVMDRFMCFDNDYSDAELAAVTTFFDFFYEDTRYSDWVIMEGFLPATSAGGEIMAAADPANAAWIEIVGSSYFYPTAKAEWADVKQGVINVLQQALLGEDVQGLLDALQAEIAG